MELASNVLTKSYTTSIALTSGQTYKFMIQARNSVGLSDTSVELSILAAQVPDQPSAPTTQINGQSVDISWLAPFDGSSTITSYTITIR